MQLREPEANAVSPGHLLVGVACGVAAMLTWASWFALTRLSITRELGVADIAALRVGGGSLVLLPLFLRDMGGIPRRAWWGGIVLSACWGAPFVFLVALGIKLTSAAHAAALTPGTMPVFAGLIGWAVLRERPGRQRLLGFAVIAGGVLTLSLSFVGAESWLGNAALLAAAALWAIYTLRVRRSGLSPVQAAALVCLYSSAGYLPLYLLSGAQRLTTAPLTEVLLQAAYQGVLVGGLSVVAYNQAVARLGAGAAAAIVSLVPVAAALLAIPVLGEVPTPLDAVAITAIAAGVFLAARAASTNAAALNRAAESA